MQNEDCRLFKWRSTTTTFQGRKEWICKGSICRQVSGSSKCLFTCICGILLPLNPSTSTVYARSAFYPSLRFTLSLQSAFYTQSAFYPWSAVCSLQSAVCVLHWPVFAVSWNLSFVYVNQLFPLSLPCSAKENFFYCFTRWAKNCKNIFEWQRSFQF